MDTTITPAERELRRAKEALAYLNQITSQAQRGAAVDYDRALHTVGAVTAHLQLLNQGQLPADPSSGTGTATTTTSSSAWDSHHTGVGGSPSASFSPPPAVAGDSGGGGVVVGGPGSSANVHARTVGSGAGGGAVTELQRRRAQQVLSELQLIETTLRRYQRRSQQTGAAHASNVQQLLGKYGEASGARNTYDELDALEREQQGLLYTRQRMQRMNAESHAVLQALRGQTSRMSGTGNRLANMMESIGISNTTILQIVRRNHLDAWLVYTGILVLLVLMWHMW